MCLHPKQPIVALVCRIDHCSCFTGLQATRVVHIIQIVNHGHVHSLLLQSVGNMVAEYDLLSGCKLGSTEAGGTPISLQYTSDAALLVAVLKVCCLLLCTHCFLSASPIFKFSICEIAVRCQAS